MALGVGVAMGGVVLRAEAQGSRVLPEVLLRTVEEEMPPARLSGLDPREGVTVLLKDSTRRTIPALDLVSIHFDGAVEPEIPRGWRIRLHNGDELYGWLTEAVEQSIMLDTRDIGPVRIPLEVIALIVTPQASSPAHADLITSLERSNVSDDTVLLSNGDTIAGFMSRLDHEALVLDGPGGVQRIAKEVFLAMRLAADPPSPPPRPYYRVHLRASGKLTLETVMLSGGLARGLTTFGEEIRFDAGRVASLRVVGGRWQPLDGIEPVSATHVPMMGLDRPHRKSRNVTGGVLRVAGREYESGIGVQSRSILTYDLGGGYERFVTAFGLDDDASPEADVSVRIVVDGVVRFAQEHVRRGRLYGPIRIDLLGPRRHPSGESGSGEAQPAAQLQLIVDFGDNGDIGDRFNWIEPALIHR